jgi:SET domain-containing protein
VGEIIDAKAFKRRMEKYSEKNNEHFYVMSLQNDTFIDATKRGNISRFFNHSCDPNCETQKVKIKIFWVFKVQLSEKIAYMKKSTSHSIF